MLVQTLVRCKDSRLETASNIAGVLLDLAFTLLAVESLLTTELLKNLLAVLLRGVGCVLCLGVRCRICGG